MEFLLPTALQQKLVAYDPTLKRTLAASKPKSNRKATSFPLGTPDDLIPHSIVPQTRQLEAVHAINNSEVRNRYKCFYRNEPNLPLIAIIYHYESAWYAMWFPPVGNDGYFYGFTIAFKNGAKAEEKMRSLRLKDDEPILQRLQNYGRSEFHVITAQVNALNIANNKLNRHYWNIAGVCNYTEKGGEIRKQCIDKFDAALKSKIPVWKDTHSLWDRINPQINNIGCILKSEVYEHRPELNQDWVLTVDSALGLLELSENTKEKLKTPFLRKWIQSECNSVIERFNSLETQYKKSITCGFRRIQKVTQWIDAILSIWPDTPVDHFQSRIPLFLSTHCPVPTSHRYKQCTVWLRNNMPVNSFFSIIDKHYETEKEALKAASSMAQQHRFSSDLEMHLHPLQYNLRDTFAMIEKILDHGQTIDPPKRWRITEFHDTVQAISWKIQNPNLSLPQDFFAEPVKVSLNADTWTFFQPYDTHQLAAWGQAVRNCVGSASGYAEGVKKKKHFIVLCMVNNQPRFTVQLKVNNGKAIVDQIVDISNARLSTDDKELYSLAFCKAFKQLNDSLTGSTEEQ